MPGSRQTMRALEPHATAARPRSPPRMRGDTLEPGAGPARTLTRKASLGDALGRPGSRAMSWSRALSQRGGNSGDRPPLLGRAPQPVTRAPRYTRARRSCDADGGRVKKSPLKTSESPRKSLTYKLAVQASAPAPPCQPPLCCPCLRRRACLSMPAAWRGRNGGKHQGAGRVSDNQLSAHLSNYPMRACRYPKLTQSCPMRAPGADPARCPAILPNLTHLSIPRAPGPTRSNGVVS